MGRSQALLYHLSPAQTGETHSRSARVSRQPYGDRRERYLLHHPADHRLSPEETRAAFGAASYVASVDESKALDTDRSPKIIVSASGMATGGRVLHHLKTYAPDGRNLILFSGFQAGGTRGADIVAGAAAVKIFGEYVPIRAEVANLDMLSAHADAEEILALARRISRRAPKMTFIMHGEPAAADTLRKRIDETLHWPCTVPDYRDTVELMSERKPMARRPRLKPNASASRRCKKPMCSCAATTNSAARRVSAHTPRARSRTTSMPSSPTSIT